MKAYVLREMREWVNDEISTEILAVYLDESKARDGLHDRQAKIAQDYRVDVMKPMQAEKIAAEWADQGLGGEIIDCCCFDGRTLTLTAHMLAD